MSRQPRGASLLELMIALTVQAILIAIFYFTGIDGLTRIMQTKKQTAFKDASAIYYGLWGPSEDYNGFIGDNGYTGTLPSDWISYIPGSHTTSDTYAWMRDNLTFFQSPNNRAITLLGVNGGWNGPYVSMGLNHGGLRSDPWGNSWKLDADGTVRSAGWDQLLNTSDDVVSNPGPVKLGQFGTLYIRVFDPEGRPIGTTLDASGTAVEADSRIFVEVTNPTPGTGHAMGFTAATWDPTTQNFSISGLWPGRHAVQVTGFAGSPICDGSAPIEGHQDTCAGLWGSEIAYVRGGGVATINVHLTHVAKAEI